LSRGRKERRKQRSLAGETADGGKPETAVPLRTGGLPSLKSALAALAVALIIAILLSALEGVKEAFWAGRGGG
jgi:hypothetical protein